MRRLVAYALAVCLSGPAFAQPIVGDWRCQEQDSYGIYTTDATFTEAGKFLATIYVEFLDPDMTLLAELSYQATYTLKDGILTDTPESAAIASFTADGQDISDSEEAREMVDHLMSHGYSRTGVEFVGPDFLNLRQGKYVSACQRR